MPIKNVGAILILLLSILFPAPAEAGQLPCGCNESNRHLLLLNPPLQGSDVRELQQRLAQLGFYFGPLNGLYNQVTARAVKNFQASKGLNPSGEVGPATWSALGENSSAISQRQSTGGPPAGSKLRLLIELDKRTLTILVDGKPWRTYPVAIGKFETPSPVGEWKVVHKSRDWGGSFGTRWMGLNVPWGVYGIHGTNKPWTIGSAASAGCFRMHNQDVEEIFPWIDIGTPVEVKGPYTKPTAPLKRGQTMPEVVTVQALLRQAGFYLFGPTDGFYGVMTEIAIKQFQYLHSLEATGELDEATLETLLMFSRPEA
ncbi:MAG: hypothetical protein PWP65_28 [Clostridia bacterium]|nr:hypothetical protein [Clostridia bacterium]